MKTILLIYYSLKKIFSHKNTKSEELLSLKSFLLLDIFDKLCFVNSCPIFVGSFENLIDGLNKK